jgi:hypothetical protein
METTILKVLKRFAVSVACKTVYQLHSPISDVQQDATVQYYDIDLCFEISPQRQSERFRVRRAPRPGN